MPLTQRQIEETADVLRRSLRFKLTTYRPEPNSMPFHTRLLGTDRLALYSFIHSMSTNFGTSIFEQVAAALAKPLFAKVGTQTIVGNVISEGAQIEILKIMNELTTASGEPNMSVEVERLRSVCQSGRMINVKLARADVSVETDKNQLFLFDIKTAKPNKGNFQGFKQMLLEWTAATLATNPNAHVISAIAIPYNPYDPKPYSRWTMRGMLDVSLQAQLFVAKEFWDFIGGEGAYEQLLDVFERVGMELRSEIDARFAQFR